MKLHNLNDVANNVESTHYVILASLNSEPMGKLINRIPGSSLLISRQASKDSKRHSLNILYL